MIPMEKYVFPLSRESAIAAITATDFAIELIMKRRERVGGSAGLSEDNSLATLLARREHLVLFVANTSATTA